MDVGWSDNAATTGLAAVVLEGLDYRPTITYASVRVAFDGMKARNVDAFLGYWKPVMSPRIEPFVKSGHIQVLEQPNLVGAKATLAVPEYLYAKGLKSFADIARFEHELDGRIFGIEPGTGSNALIQRMIDKNEFGLGNFRRMVHDRHREPGDGRDHREDEPATGGARLAAQEPHRARDLAARRAQLRRRRRAGCRAEGAAGRAAADRRRTLRTRAMAVSIFDIFKIGIGPSSEC